MLAGAAHGQDSRKVPISFLPPPLENATYSLGIYEAKSGKLVRRLQEIAPESAFTVGLNGLMTNWDGRDDAGKAVAPGHYAARGYAVGPWKVEGVAVQGNDWANEDENLRIKHVEAIALIPADEGLVILATMADGHGAILRFSDKGELVWRHAVEGMNPAAHPWLEVKGEHISLMPGFGADRSAEATVSTGVYQVSDGREQSEVQSNGGMGIHLNPLTTPPPIAAAPDATAPPVVDEAAPEDEKAILALVRKAPAELRSKGKDNTFWVAAGAAGLVQTARDGSVLRRLEPVPGDPLPRQASASTKTERLYLLESKPGWQRVRGLAWNDVKEENGHAVSTWQTFFERNIRLPDKDSGPAEDPKVNGPTVEISLAENPLSPGKPQKAKLTANYDEKGSYLTANGLRLRQISERTHLKTAKLAKGKGDSLLFLQGDGAAQDEFSIAGVRSIMEFDAGEFEMTADGEKTHAAKPPEPPDL